MHGHIDMYACTNARVYANTQMQLMQKAGASLLPEQFHLGDVSPYLKEAISFPAQEDSRRNPLKFLLIRHCLCLASGDILLPARHAL